MLGLLPKTTSEMRYELDLISAARKLEELRVTSILPVQLRLTPNRLDLFRSALQNTPRLYRMKGEVLFKLFLTPLIPL